MTAVLSSREFFETSSTASTSSRGRPRKTNHETRSTASEHSKIEPAPSIPIRTDERRETPVEKKPIDRVFSEPKRVSSVSPVSIQRAPISRGPPRPITSPARNTAGPAKNVLWDMPKRRDEEVEAQVRPVKRPVEAKFASDIPSPVRAERPPAPENVVPTSVRWGVPTREDPDRFGSRRRCGVSPPPERAAEARDSQTYARMTIAEQNETRQKFADRFLILQRRYPGWGIAIPGEDSSLDYMHSLYESYVKQINIDANASQFETILAVLFVAVEYGASRAGVDMKGYAKMQLKGKKRYHAVLMELGEKYTGPSLGSSPEMKLVMMMLLQAVIFLVAKYAEKTLNVAGFSDMIYNYLDTTISDKMNEAPASAVDDLGLPVASGTETEINNLSRKERGEAPAPAAPTLDLGGILSSLVGGGGPNLGGIISSLVGANTKQPSPTRPTSPPQKLSPRARTVTPKFAE